MYLTTLALSSNLVHIVCALTLLPASKLLGNVQKTVGYQTGSPDDLLNAGGSLAQIVQLVSILSLLCMWVTHRTNEFELQPMYWQT